jgi:hypothetical protein
MKKKDLIKVRSKCLPTSKLVAQLATKKQGGALILYVKGVSEDEGRAKLAENLLDHASPFNKDLSNGTAFSLNHLAGQ